MLAYALMPGTQWNPLRRHRNVPCPCGCGKKAKAHLGQYEVLPDKIALQVKGYLRALSAAGLIALKPGELK